MKIGIDARFVGPQGTGLGKYTEKLIENLQGIDAKNSYIVFLKKDNWSYLNLKNKNFQKKLADVPWYSAEEQFKMPSIYSSQNLDLLHVPHFNVPILYRGKFIVTIHDLIHHHFSQESTTTKNPFVFKLKRFGYKAVIRSAVARSKKIIVPSNFVKGEIASNFKVNGSKIIVTYEAAEEEYFEKPAAANQKPDYILYIGNAYPHKNINRLLSAYQTLSNKKNFPKLKIVSPRNVFTQRLQKNIASKGLENKVEVLGYQPPQKLAKILSQSTAYVFPSLAEGFGIPGLNAMAAGVPVAASQIPTLKEIYQNAALYFDPRETSDIAQKISAIVKNQKLRSDLIKKGSAQVKKYSWRKMAEQTLAIYNSL